MKNVYKSFISEYPIVSIEDPFDQDDWETYAKLTSEIGEKVQIVGDDLLVTNPKVKLCSDYCGNFMITLFRYTHLLSFSACRESNSGEDL